VSTPDPYDGPCPRSGIRDNTENLGTWLGIWSHPAEPDAHARRCASDAIDAIDAALRELHAIRARLVSENRTTNDATAARADAPLRGSKKDGCD
jgi:hypothetical protein